MTVQTAHRLEALGIKLPSKPMAPIYSDDIPGTEGKDSGQWGYQIKWDGIRALAAVSEGSVQLRSKNLLPLQDAFPEITALLLEHFPNHKGLLLDGEIVMFDTEDERPQFHALLKRLRSKRAGKQAAHSRYHILYAVFDVLHEGETDWRSTSYIERHQRLTALLPHKHPQLFTCDLFTNGEALWQWVQMHHWEGVISKRLDSTYHEGKKHQDWWKKKVAVHLQVELTGITIREGRVASLIMSYEGDYMGRVSIGLTGADKQVLLEYGSQYQTPDCPFPAMPKELSKEQIVWLSRPIKAEVTGLELTAAGLLRHPKLLRVETR